MNKEIDAVILAGGLGTRMGEITKDYQKCLLPIENKPILLHILDGIQSAFGSARVIIATGYEGNVVKKQIGMRYRNIKIEYVHNPEKLETKRRLLLSEGLLKGPFLFLAGDIIVNPCQLEKIATNFEKEKSTEIMGIISAATFHEPALSHALITVENNNRLTELIFPPPDIWTNQQLREMNLAYYNQRFLYKARVTAPDVKYVVAVISLAIKEGEKFMVERYFDRWYHFVKPEDLNTTIVFNK